MLAYGSKKHMLMFVSLSNSRQFVYSLNNNLDNIFFVVVFMYSLAFSRNIIIAGFVGVVFAAKFKVHVWQELQLKEGHGRAVMAAFILNSLTR